MDEEEKKRQAASVAFAQAAGYEDPNQAVSDIRARGAANAPTVQGDIAGMQQDSWAQAAADVPDMQRISSPGELAAGRQMGIQPSVPPAAASAFSQLDAPAPGPLEYDPATAAGLPQETQDAFRRNWDDNLAAARKAIEGNGPGKEERDALAIYTDQLVRMADDYQANRNRVDRAQAPADPYAAQRQREANVASRLGEYDLFSDPNATRRLYTPQSSQANAYQLALDGGQENAKPFFDYF